MRLLVTGAAGVLGRALVRLGALRGHEVLGVVRALPQALPPAAARDPAHAHWSLVAADVEDPGGLTRATLAARPEVIIHTAARGVRRGHGLSEQALLSAHVAAGRALALASRQSGARVVWVGSCFEYAPSSSPMPEDHPLAPTSAYGRAKLAGLRAFEAGKVLHLVARPFHVYGPGEAPERLVPALFSAVRGQGENAFGDPAMERDLLFVDDAATALLLAAERLRESDAALTPGLSLQLSTGHGATIGEIARLAAKVAGDPGFVFKFRGAPPLPGYDPGRLVGSPTRAQALLGWRARTPLEEGLRQSYFGIDTPMPE